MVVDDTGAIARHRPPARPGFDVVGRIGNEDVQRFGRADPVQDPQSSLFVPAPENLRGQRLAGRNAKSDRGKIRSILVDRLQMGGIEGRNSEIDGRPKAFDDRKAGRWTGPMLVEHRGRAHPERHRHIVPEPIGEEQLGLGIADILRAQSENVHAHELAGHDHVAMTMNRGLGSAGRSGRVKPKTIIFGRRRDGSEIGRRLSGQGPKRRPRPFGSKHDARRMGGCGDCRLDLLGIFRRIEQRGRGRIVDHEAVARPAEQRIERDRDDPRLDRAPEQIEEVRTILHHHQQPLAPPKPQPYEGGGTAVDVGG